MIIRTQEDVTKAVLSEVERAQDPRTREILSAFVRHLHAFAREVRLTEKEFREGCAFVAQLGQKTTESHNEVVLMAGTVGLSTLVCLLNNGGPGRESGSADTTANLLGPFWRTDSPPTENGASIVRSPTPGDPLFVTATVKDLNGAPVAGAEVDVWHSSTEGYYENQDPIQADMNLRGKFTTDANGQIRFRTIKPAGYPIPVDGPVGKIVRALRRHNMRPAHIHFLILKDGFKAHISQIYVNDDPNLETDVQFGVTASVIGNYVRHEEGPAPAPDVKGPWYQMNHTFVIEPGQAVPPKAPITEKTRGSRPDLTVLERR